jgi:pSer/pThr/pTyr-binding forkhead associated (FHA) protein
MSERATSSNKTRIGKPLRSAARIPERYQASLVIIDGHATGMEYTIATAATVIGRDKEADIMLKDPLVSRRHAVIEYHDGNYVLKDLDSTNGIHMKGAVVKEASLCHSDTFRIGNTTLQFVLEDAPRSKTYEVC